MFVLSLFLPLVSVHIYCENRSVAAVFGVVTVSVFFYSQPSCIDGTEGRVWRGQETFSDLRVKQR